MKKNYIYKIFSKIPTLESSRLILRKMHPSDAHDMYEYARLEEVSRYLTWTPHKNERYTEDYLKYISARYAAGEFHDWGVVLRENRRMIGTCGFTRFDMASNCAEIGYVLHPEYWGRGLATEASRLVMDFAFINLNMHRVEAKFIMGNSASLGVMRNLGMTFEGYARDRQFIKGEYKTIGCCAILKDEYFRYIQRL